MIKNAEHTDIAPHWSHDDRIITPNNRIYKLNETGRSCPKHVGACPCIPCLHMPWQRHKSKDET